MIKITRIVSLIMALALIISLPACEKTDSDNDFYYIETHDIGFSLVPENIYLPDDAGIPCITNDGRIIKPIAGEEKLETPVKSVTLTDRFDPGRKIDVPLDTRAADYLLIYDTSTRETRTQKLFTPDPDTGELTSVNGRVILSAITMPDEGFSVMNVPASDYISDDIGIVPTGSYFRLHEAIDGEYSVLLSRFDSEGKLVFEFPSQDLGFDCANLPGIAAGADNSLYLYFYSDNTWRVVSPDGEISESFELPESIDGQPGEIYSDAEWNVLLTVDESGASDTEKRSVFSLKKGICERIYETPPDAGSKLITSDGKIFYEWDNLGISTDGTEILSFDDIFLTGEDIISVGAVGDEFPVIYFDRVEQEKRVAVIRHMTPERYEKLKSDGENPQISPESVEPLIVAMSDAEAYITGDYINHYNREAGKRVVARKIYPGDKDAADSALTRDIMSGEVPDILLFSGNLRYEKFRDQSLFTDLYPLMESGSSLSRGDLLPCVTKPFENADGTLTSLVMEFGLSTITGSAKTLRNDYLTITDLSDFSKELENDIRLIAGNDAKTPGEVFVKFIGAAVPRYVDYEKKTFDPGDGLKSLLELCGSLGMPADDLAAESPESYQSGKIALRMSDITGIGDFIREYSFFYPGDDLRFVGYPANDNSNSTMIRPTVRIAVTSDCSDPIGAWSYISAQVGYSTKMWKSRGKPYSDPGVRNPGFPCTKSAAEAMIAYAYEYAEVRYYYSKLDKSWVTQVNTSPAEYRVPDKNFGYMTEGAENILRGLFDSAANAVSTDEALISIIREEASAYFSGAKTADEVVKLIENRVTTLINE